MSRTLAAIVAATLVPVALSGCSSSTGTGTVAKGCTPRHSFQTLTKGTLTVSTYTYAPATIVKGNDLQGVEGGLLKQIAQWECVKLRVLEQAPAGVIPAVQSGRADLAAGSWYRTQKRADVLNLTDPIYTDNMVLVSKDGAIRAVADLKGRRVGTFEGNLWNADLQALLGDSLKIYSGESETFRDLKAGRIDVAVDGAGGSTNMLKVLGLTGYQMATPPPDPAVKATANPGQIGWPNTRSNTALNTALNEDIATLRSSGEVARLLKQYGYPDSAATVGSPSLL